MTKRHVVALLAAFAAFCASADTETVDGYTWSYRINGGSAEIVGDNYCAVSPAPSGTVIIPSTLGGKPVTGIGEWALYGCENMTDVTIPDSVTDIGYGAFCYCSGLTHIAMPDSVTNIENSAFVWCAGLTNVSMSANVARIGWDAFAYCSGLTSVTIPGSVSVIGDSAFAYCSSLASVTISDGVASIGNYAFSYCSVLTGVTIPASVFNIGYGAFEGCSEALFDTASIPGLILIDGWAIGHADTLSGDLNLTGVRGIGGSTFSGCTGLTSVTIPASVSAICYGAFSGCTGLTSVTIPASVSVIGDYAFSSCSGLGSVAIDNGVISIGKEAFSWCTGLTGIAIPASVTSIGDGAFSNCENLGTFIVASGNPMYKIVSGLLLTKDGKTLVAAPGTSTSVTIPGGVQHIGNSAFYCCRALAGVTIPGGVVSIGDNAFYGCESLSGIDIPDGVVAIGKGTFRFCRGLGSLSLPDSVANIGEGAFYGCDGLADADGFVIVRDVLYFYNPVATGKSHVAIPAGVARIGERAFDSCGGWLTSVTIPAGVTNIGNGAFAYCNSLANIEIPEGVTSIGEIAFEFCSDLANITIPASVTRVGYLAFSGCSSLTNVVFLGDAPAYEYGVFQGVASDCTAYVRKDSTGWGVDIPGTWRDGLRIEYFPEAPLITLPAGASAVTNTSGEVVGYYTKKNAKGNTTAKAMPGYVFTGWFTATGTKAYSTKATIADKTRKSKKLSPRFALARYVRALADPANGGTVTGGGTYADGKAATLRATPKKGYAFCGWYDADGNRVSLATTYKYKMAEDGAALTAVFKKESALARPVLAYDDGSFAVSTQTANGISVSNILVGVSYSATLKVSCESKVAITSVTGLPKGLSYKSGKIIGVPSARDKSYTVKVTVALSSNTAKKWTYKIAMRTASLPAWATGKFTGEGTIGGKAASVTLSVGSTGKISGKFVDSAKVQRSFTASSFKAYEDGILSAKGTMNVGKKKYAVEIAIEETEAEDESGVTVSTGSAKIAVGDGYGEATLTK